MNLMNMRLELPINNFLGSKIYSTMVVDCPSRWSLYLSLALCLVHLVGGGDSIYVAVFSFNHCWGLGWSFFTIFFAKYKCGKKFSLFQSVLGPKIAWYFHFFHFFPELRAFMRWEKVCFLTGSRWNISTNTFSQCTHQVGSFTVSQPLGKFFFYFFGLQTRCGSFDNL